MRFYPSVDRATCVLTNLAGALPGDLHELEDLEGRLVSNASLHHERVHGSLWLNLRVA